MLCPNCHGSHVLIIDSRTDVQYHYKRRRRQCKECGARWTTVERIAGKVQLRPMEKDIKTPVRKMEDLNKWAEIAKRNGIKHSTFLSRVNQYGWDVEKAATTPLQKRDADT